MTGYVKPAPWRGVLRAALCAVVVGVAAAPAAADPPANTIFGYEASTDNARILEYSIDPKTSTVAYSGRSCVPNAPAPGDNGRGVALGERGDDSPTRVLFNTFVSFPGFTGDGFIHRNTLPTDGCQALAPIPFVDGPGGAVQDDVGALDFHETDDHNRSRGDDPEILYASGYRGRTPDGVGPGDEQHLYKIDAETGALLGRCHAPAQGLDGNDTLTFARLKLDGRTQEVLLTDFGEYRAFGATNLFAVDAESLTLSVAPAPCAVVATYPGYAANAGSQCCTGADFEKIPKPPGERGKPDSLVLSSLENFWDANHPPFNPARFLGSAAPSDGIEDITVNRLNPPDR